MAPIHKHYRKHAFHALFSLSKNHQNHIYQSPLPNSDHAFPMLAIALLSIMGTAFLLLGYYIISNKCCSNWPHVNLPRWLTLWRARRNEDSFIALSPDTWNRGLDESIIRAIPTFQYKVSEGRSIHGCVVCLNEFQEQDMLRILPNCSHSFHLDCIDVWFQSNTNCPLCRTSISGTTSVKYPIDHIIAPTSSPQGSQQYTDSLMGGDEDYVVIELGGEDEAAMLSQRQQERSISKEVQMQLRSQTSPMKINMEEKLGNVKLKQRKRQHVSIMGDECIDVRVKDNQFIVQPIRRSFSWDSAVDQQLYSSVQEIIQQNYKHKISTTEECSDRVRRSFLPFGHGRATKIDVLPIGFEI